MSVIKGVDEGKQFVVEDPATSLGRDPLNPVSLHDTEVSRRHAEILRHPEGFLLRDVGSANGTFVNSKAITEVLLFPGDQIQIGQSILLVIASQSQQNRKRTGNTDLADRISMITRQDVELSSAIVNTVTEEEGSRILSNPDIKAGEWLQDALTNLGILYELSQLVSHVLDLDDLLDRVLELIFRSLKADRGCVLLRDRDTTDLAPRAIQWRKGEPDSEETIPVSRSVVDHVLEHEEGILVSDATQDERFKSRQSIIRYGIREVICVPLKGRHETIGVLYLDTHSFLKELIKSPGGSRTGLETDEEDAWHPSDDEAPRGVFTKDHLALAVAIGHQAALAIEETRYYDALVQAERLAAIGQTVAALSHHIKNILQGLRSGSDVLKMGLAEPSLDRELIQQGWTIVEKNQGKIYNLVMDMLSFSKERVPSLENVNVNDVVEEIMELLAGKAKDNGVKLQAKLKEVPLCQADPEGIHRALLNVVSNALDAVEDAPKPLVQVGTRVDTESQLVRIIVADNGVGIPEDKLDDIFKPFLSTKGARGTGLGLAVSRKILREHGGDILVQSEPGEGSRFVLQFPIRNPMEIDPSGTSSVLPKLDTKEEK